MNTLALSKIFQKAGFDQKQAEVLAEAIETRGDELVTKEFMTQFVRAEMATQTTRLTVTMIAVIGLAVAIIKLF